MTGFENGSLEVALSACSSYEYPHEMGPFFRERSKQKL